MYHLLSLMMSIYLLGARIHLASEGGRALNQVKPNHFYYPSAFYCIFFFECNRSGRALNQVKPNHFCFFMYLIIIFDVMEVVVPSTKSSRTTSTFYVFNIFLLFFECNGSGRALNQVKPNHFPSLVFFNSSLYLAGFLT